MQESEVHKMNKLITKPSHEKFKTIDDTLHKVREKVGKRVERQNSYQQTQRTLYNSSEGAEKNFIPDAENKTVNSNTWKHLLTKKKSIEQERRLSQIE